MDYEEITIYLEGTYIYSKEDMNRLIQNHLPLVMLVPLFKEEARIKGHYVAQLWVVKFNLDSIAPNKREQLMKMYKKIIKLLLK